MVNTKLLLVWNIVLSLLVIVLLWGTFALSTETRNLSSQNIAQNVVLCTYIEEILAYGDIDISRPPDCQTDIKKLLEQVESGNWD